jgi:hypothetical protein
MRKEEKNKPREGGQVITFEDVAGVDEAKAELMEVVECLRDSARYTKLNAKPPSGVLLVRTAVSSSMPLTATGALLCCTLVTRSLASKRTQSDTSNAFVWPRCAEDGTGPPHR